MKGFQLRGIERLGGKHWSEDQDDIAYAGELWKSVNPARVAELLKESLALKAARCGY